MDEYSEGYSVDPLDNISSASVIYRSCARIHCLMLLIARLLETNKLNYDEAASEFFKLEDAVESVYQNLREL